MDHTVVCEVLDGYIVIGVEVSPIITIINAAISPTNMEVSTP